MANYSYSAKIGEKDAAAVGKALPISTKQAIEICNFIRGKRLERAKAMLDNALTEKYPIPFKRFTDGVGHKKGNLTSGRYPKNACTQILSLLNSAQANAQFKGLSSSDLFVSHINAQKGASTWKYGRRRRKAKNTTVEVVLSERVEEKKAKTGGTEKPKQEKKEAKTEAKEKVVEKKAESKKPETKEKAAEKPKVQEKTEQKAKVEEKKETKPESKAEKPKAAPKKSESPKTEEKAEK